MELGTSVYTYLWACSLEGALERCAGFGFRTLELVATPPLLRPAHFGPFERRRLCRLLGRLGLKVFSVNPTFLDINLVSLNPAIRRASLKELKDTIRLAAEIGAQLVVISAGRRHPLIPAPYQDAFELALDGIGECLRLAEQLGVSLGLENVPSVFVETAEGQLRLISALKSPALKAVYDVANGYLVEDPADGLGKIAPYLALVHFSDALKQRWVHLPVGLGELNFGRLTGRLKEIGYTGPVMLETTYAEDPDGGIRRSIEALGPLGLRPGG